MSKTKTTVAKKAIAGVASLAMAVAFMFGGAVAPASAQSVSELTAQINSLLSTISALQAQLNALQGDDNSGNTGVSTGYLFTSSLSQGDTGEEVLRLQEFLNAHSPVTRVAVAGAGSPGNETSYYGPATAAAVTAFQELYASDVLAPVGLSQGTGYFGPSTRAKVNALNTATTPTNPTNPTVPVGSTLNVSLAASTPANTVVVAGQAIADLAHFTFTNTTGAAVDVTNLKFNRTGISSDSTLSNIYLFDGATRLTDAATVSSGVITFNNANGVFTVPANTAKTISVRADVATGTAGQIVGVSLAEVTAGATVSASLPVAGNNISIATATMGTVVLTYTGPSGVTDNPANGVRVFEASTVVSTNDAMLESLALEQRGTADYDALQNLSLFVDGVEVASGAEFTSDEMVTFDLSDNPVLLETGTRVLKVEADIVKGSSETYNLQIRRAADIRVIDSEVDQPILATDNDGSFPVSPVSANTIAAGSLSVVKANTSPSDNVTVGASNVLWSTFEFRASGEDIKIEALTVDVDTTAGDGMDNVKVFVNGSQVGSQKDVGSTGSETGTEFTFGSSFVAEAGEITTVEIYGDAKQADGVDYAADATVVAGVSIAAADTEGLSSGNTVSAVSIVDGNTRTIASSSVTATKFSGYGAQTMIAGANNARLGSFVLSAGSTEGINVNSIVINLSSDEAATITNLMLKDANTGVQIGTTKASPSTANSFSVNFTIPASGSKTIDVVGNIKSGSDIGTWTAVVDSTTGGRGVNTANSATIVTDLTLQTITIGTGTLTVTVGDNPPADDIVIAGSNNVHVGQFKFNAQNSSFDIDEMMIKIPNGAATAVSAVKLAWNGESVANVPDAQTSTIDLPSATETYATATFTGLNLELPTGERTLDVYVNIPTIDAAGQNISGNQISVVIDADNGFKATDAAGTQDTTAAVSDVLGTATSNYGTSVVRAAQPVISASPVTGTLAAGSDKTIGRFTIAADSSGNTISWGKIVFDVTKSSGVTVGATTTLAIKDSNNNTIAGTFATTTGSHASQSEAFTSTATTGSLVFVPTNPQVIASGVSKTYTLRGTVGITGTGLKNLDLSIDTDSTSVTTAAFSSIHTAVGDTSETFVWSDRSQYLLNGGSHDTSDTDWTNDYLIDELPITVGNLSVSVSS